jgi:aldehyde:ferredoxin oxidoreductase
MNVVNDAVAQPSRRAIRGRQGHLGRGDARASRERRQTNLVTNQACFACTVACGRISKIDETHYTVINKPKYWGALGGLEYKALQGTCRRTLWLR